MALLWTGPDLAVAWAYEVGERRVNFGRMSWGGGQASSEAGNFGAQGVDRGGQIGGDGDVGLLRTLQGAN